MSALLLQAVSSAALGLRRLTSENLEDSPQVMVGALLVSASRHDAALEQIIGRMSLEPFDTVVHRQAEQAAAQSWKGPSRDACEKEPSYNLAEIQEKTNTA